jgi:N4-(beta-N-acetylglucosaminyl)-L-asparaginase
MQRRDFIRTAAVSAGALATGASTLDAAEGPAAPFVNRGSRARPIVLSDLSGIGFTNNGPESAVERAFRGITEGEDVLDALIAGVNIPENDPTESGIGFGGLPNADGVVQLDSCCMHGPRKWAGGVAGIEGVKTPSRVARAVAELTDHHLITGHGAREFARSLGFEIHPDLNTDNSRQLWLEWQRRVDPGHWLDPNARLSGQGRPGEETDPDVIRRNRGGNGAAPAGTGGVDGEKVALLTPAQMRLRADAYLDAGLGMVRDGLIPAHSFWGTINCNGVSADGDICGVTTTSGLAWKIPGRVGDSPILGAGLYVDNDVGAAGSTGRGEANLYNLSSFMIVEFLRQGMAPLDAGMAMLERIRANNVEPRLQREDGEPSFDVRFFIVNKAGDYAGVAMYGTAENRYAVCDENGAREETLEGLLEG